MTSIADGSVSIQTSSESVPSTPTWLGEVVLIVGYLRKHGVLAIATSIPVFFISGAFGPLSFGNNVVLSVLAQLFPMYYAVVLMQHAFHGFDLNTYGLGMNILILSGYALGLILLAALVLRRSTVAS